MLAFRDVSYALDTLPSVNTPSYVANLQLVFILMLHTPVARTHNYLQCYLAYQQPSS